MEAWRRVIAAVHQRLLLQAQVDAEQQLHAATADDRRKRVRGNAASAGEGNAAGVGAQDAAQKGGKKAGKAKRRKHAVGAEVAAAEASEGVRAAGGTGGGGQTAEQNDAEADENASVPVHDADAVALGDGHVDKPTAKRGKAQRKGGGARGGAKGKRGREQARGPAAIAGGYAAPAAGGARRVA